MKVVILLQMIYLVLRVDVVQLGVHQIVHVDVKEQEEITVLGSDSGRDRIRARP